MDWEFLKQLDAQARETERIYRSLADSGVMREAQRGAGEMERVARTSLVGEEFCRAMAPKLSPDIDAARAITEKMQLMSASLGPDPAIASMIERFTAPDPATSKLVEEALRAKVIDSSWLSAAERIAASTLAASVDDQLSAVYRALERDCATGAISAFDRARLAEIVVPDFPEWQQLVGGLDKMVLAQQNLAAELAAGPFGRLEFPRIVSEWPSLGVLSHAELLRGIGGAVPGRARVSAAEPEPLEQKREELFENLDVRLMELLGDYPDLREDWVAAKEERRAGRRRSWRFFSASLRVVVDDVLRMVAPLSVVEPWCKVNGELKPSRRSQLRYVAAVFQNPTFGEYAALDFEQMFEVWKLVANKVHGHKVPSDTELRRAERRTAVWLVGVLTLSKARKDN